MVCQTASEVQARLALRALWPPVSRATGGGDDIGPPKEHMSTLQQQLRAEMEDVLRASLQRRLKRIEQKVRILCSDGGVNLTSATSSVAVSGATFGPSVSVQTEDSEAAQRLITVLERSLQSAEMASRTTQKTYGPSGKQSKLPDPVDEKRDDLVLEEKCMENSLTDLVRALNSRERQIGALQSQLDSCKNMCKEKEDATTAAKNALRELVAHPASPPRIHEERLCRLRQRVAELRRNLDNTQEKAMHYQKLAEQQRRYYLQNERVAIHGDRLRRHPAGEISQVPRPLPLGDMKAEGFDVGTAIANPYICDSWPFEPNVLAQRTSKEATMQMCIEETPEDLEEECMRLHFLQLRLPTPGRGYDDEDDFDDHYTSPSETARSL